MKAIPEIETHPSCRPCRVALDILFTTSQHHLPSLAATLIVALRGGVIGA